MQWLRVKHILIHLQPDAGCFMCGWVAPQCCLVRLAVTTQPDLDVDPEDMILGLDSTTGEFQLMRTPSSLAIRADPFAGTSLAGGAGSLSGAMGGYVLSFRWTFTC
jgi:hypothetical protein